MRKVSFLVSVVIAFALACMPLEVAAASAKNRLITGGAGVGPVRIGQNITAVKSILGSPASVVASPNDPNSKLMNYPKYGLAVFMGSAGGVVGVTVTSSNYATREGIRVGSPAQQVTKVYGRGLQRGQGNVAYANRGLAFTMRKGVVSTIYVVKVEEDRALLGDRIIVPGKRVGDIKIGFPISAIAQAWGEADSVTALGSGSGSQLYRYKEEAVGLIVSKGRVLGMVLETGDFITAKGVKVGSSKSEVVKAFGKGYSVDGGRFIYERLGIGFSFSQNRVQQITVLQVGK